MTSLRCARPGCVLPACGSLKSAYCYPHTPYAMERARAEVEARLAANPYEMPLLPPHRGVHLCVCGPCALKFKILKTLALLRWREAVWDGKALEPPKESS